MRSQGRHIFATYLGSRSNLVLTALNTLRHRLGIQPAAHPNTRAPRVYDDGVPMPMMDDLPATDQAAESEPLGPVGPPVPSPEFRRNYSSTMAVDSYSLWNG